MTEGTGAKPGPAHGPDARPGAWSKRFDIDFGQAMAMFQRNRDVWLKTWKMNLIPPVMEPILYLVALGYGLGALIEQVDGMPYVRFIAPALITITMMQSGFFETTYSSYVRMYFQKTWDAVHATPLTVEDIMVAELGWAAMRAVVYSTIMTIVVAVFGAFTTPLVSFPTVLLVPVVGFFVGLTFAALGLMATARVPSIDTFSYVFYLFITPQFLFSGTFFPLRQLPEAVRYLAYALPLTHSVQLVRSLVLGRWTGGEPYAAMYLVVASVLFSGIAIQWAKKRMID